MTVTGDKDTMADVTQHKRFDVEAGVSEIVGAIMLISVVVVAVGIIGVVLLSQEPPQQIPNVNFMVGSNYPLTTLYIYHNGGDSLRIGDFNILLDGISTPFTLDGGGNYWTLGKRLNVPISAPPGQVTLVYNFSGGGAVVIRSASANFSVSPGIVKPDIIPTIAPPPAVCLNGSNPQDVVTFILNNVSLVGDAINQSPSTVGPVIADAISANSISFYKDDGVNFVTGTKFSFNVTKSGSTITSAAYGSAPINLNIGDFVTVTLRSNLGIFKVFGLGDQIWELGASGVDLNLTFRSNGTSRIDTNTDVSHAWITGYRDLGSTISIQSAPPSTSQTVLVVNSSVRINGVSSADVAITNIRPVGLGLFVLEGDNSAHVIYFVGNAQSVTMNGIPVV